MSDKEKVLDFDDLPEEAKKNCRMEKKKVKMNVLLKLNE